jgi:hypothetical protein
LTDCHTYSRPRSLLQSLRGRERAVVLARRVCCAVALCCIATAVKAQDLPPIEGKSLSDREAVWPADARGRTSVLVMGFSKKCSTASRAWLDRLEIEYGRDKRVVIYLVPFLDQVRASFAASQSVISGRTRLRSNSIRPFRHLTIQRRGRGSSALTGLRTLTFWWLILAESWVA